MNQQRKFIIQLLVALVCVFVPIFSTSALTVAPARLEVSGNPGSQLKLDMVLMNDKDENQVFYSSYANFEAQGESGTPSFIEAKDGLGTWMNVPETVSLIPFESKTIPVIITIPESADPGGHFASVFWSTVPPNGSTPGQVSIGAKLGVLVLLKVNGDISEGGSIVNFNTLNGKKNYSALPVNFVYRFSNDGDDRVKPTGTLTIKNILGMKRAVLDGNPGQGNVLPHSTRRYELAWTKENKSFDEKDVPVGFWENVNYQWDNFAFGRYTATLALTFSAKGKTDASSATFFVFPWQLLIVIVFGLLIAFFILKKLMKSYNRMLIAQVREKIEEEVEEKLEERIEQQESRRTHKHKTKS